MSIIMVIVIAVSLSMDAFSLSLAYGTLNLEKSQIRLLSLIVGLYHFFMPLLGMWVGTKILNFRHNFLNFHFIILTSSHLDLLE